MCIMYSFNFPMVPLRPRCSVTSGMVQGHPRSCESYNLLCFWVTLSWVQVGVDNCLRLLKNMGKKHLILLLPALTGATTRARTLRLWSQRERERPVSKADGTCLLPLTLWFSLPHSSHCCSENNMSILWTVGEMHCLSERGPQDFSN